MDRWDAEADLADGEFVRTQSLKCMARRGRDIYHCGERRKCEQLGPAPRRMRAPAASTR